MNATLNYILEANIALIFLLAFYYAFLRRETKFTLMRYYLLSSIAISILFPLIDVATVQTATPFSIGHVIPTYWLPEVVVSGGAITEPQAGIFDFWKYTILLYLTGLSICLISVIIQLIKLFQLYRQSESYRVEGLCIAESTENKPTFSFFNFVFIGRANELTAHEMEQIICHEGVHARQWHSFDILLINVLKVFFWFNPILNTYKKIFIQLHEFEADARSVESSDVNKYCSLLARVALQSANFKLANHFNNSLTVKRIEMMRTTKENIKKWKLAAMALVIPVVFLFIACQDQLNEELIDIAQNSSHALIVPQKVQERYDLLKKENPGKNYVLLELNEAASSKLQRMESQYGLPKYIELFTTTDGETTEPIIGKAAGIFMAGTPIEGTEVKIFDEPVSLATSQLNAGNDLKGGPQTFAIMEFNSEVSQLSDAAAQKEKVYTVVGQQPEFPGGYDAMMDFIRNNLRYPLEARQQGVEGTVYVSFIVEKDGSMSEIKEVRGISSECDKEVIRVLQLFPKWIPAKHHGEIVRVKFVLPIKFEL